MKKFWAISALAALAAFFCTSCNVSDTQPQDTRDPELVGTWQGIYYSSFEDGRYSDPVTVEFIITSEKFTWISDGKTFINASPYECNVSLKDGKYFKWTEGERTGGDAIFYNISGDTMNITNANGSIIMSLPKKMTRQK